MYHVPEDKPPTTPLPPGSRNSGDIKSFLLVASHFSPSPRRPDVGTQNFRKHAATEEREKKLLKTREEGIRRYRSISEQLGFRISILGVSTQRFLFQYSFFKRKERGLRCPLGLLMFRGDALAQFPVASQGRQRDVCCANK
ncbi:hypothetical protein CEXT_175491 [Caerostris extrusa]|uniref:Uncharacterized protein n=1 Tax=Caerostris extrusa TaxID=172846 RepID=A0AAV4X9Z3_CAEEX|nr:hypothetical protein CEXT_175491 [Caerostris extrusa]